jgi:hypothetical protein
MPGDGALTNTRAIAGMLAAGRPFSLEDLHFCQL